MKANSRVARDIRENLGLEPDDTSMDGRIATMSHREQLERFLSWNGIIGYGEMMRQAVEDIYGVTLRD